MRSRTALVTVLVLAGCGAAWGQDGPDLTVKSAPRIGDYIADADGRSLYLFRADTQGGQGRDAASACEGDCLGAWPPLAADGQPDVAEGLNAGLVGTIQRSDGTTQVTYNGWPLYYFARDEQPGDTKGHDFEDFGEEWYLVAPSGEEAED